MAQPSHPHAQRVVLVRPHAAILAVAWVGLVFFLTLAVLFGVNGPPLGEALFDAALFGGCAGLDVGILRIRLMGWRSAVEAINFFTTWSLPIGRIVSVEGDDGLYFVVRNEDGSTAKARSSAYSWSLGGQLAGFPRGRRLASELTAWLADRPETLTSDWPVRTRTWAWVGLILGGAMVEAAICGVAHAVWAG